jgi:hypothetical protein
MPAEHHARSPSLRARRVTAHIERRMARHTDRVWTPADMAQLLVDALLETDFDWRKPSALDEVKRLLMAAYRIAWQIIPAERLRLAECSAAAVSPRARKGISL